jgi:hypothetical protein
MKSKINLLYLPVSCGYYAVNRNTASVLAASNESKSKPVSSIQLASADTRLISSSVELFNVMPEETAL